MKPDLQAEDILKPRYKFQEENSGPTKRRYEEGCNTVTLCPLPGESSYSMQQEAAAGQVSPGDAGLSRATGLTELLTHCHLLGCRHYQMLRAISML